MTLSRQKFSYYGRWGIFPRLKCLKSAILDGMEEEIYFSLQPFMSYELFRLYACINEFAANSLFWTLLRLSGLYVVPRKKCWEEKGMREGKLMRDLEYKKMRIILDSQTANGYLSVSPNGKSMMFTGLRMNKYQCGQHFDPEPGVLGSKGFTWSKVYWEVKVDRICWEAEEEEEAMRFRAGSRGVFGSRDLGENTGITGGYHSPGYREENEELEEEWSQENGIWPKFCLVGGFWTLQLSSAGVSICTSPEPFQILSYCPQQIGVALDYDGGKVTFTNARTQEIIYEFSSAFTGRIFPFLWLNCRRSKLTLRP
ncbi:hypothetical protein FD755_024115 [Muntiacus reevesi]|uniref:B30.2/SPRY domain-containing protein n=1 Tax=Muntiacus reevesi TaxID=9886 RepID=A0A5N3VYH7_MUNRE|nr:hypothetical protein FD755_024116 [Muntiacus reevesi]KAB0353170.1 hypothetical protein FD755_024115 [Muntiacus reevesi]